MMVDVGGRDMILKVKKLKEEAVLPERKTPGSAGFDLCACIAQEITMEPGDMAVFPTGLAAEIPEGCAAGIFTRRPPGSEAWNCRIQRCWRHRQ